MELYTRRPTVFGRVSDLDRPLDVRLLSCWFRALRWVSQQAAWLADADFTQIGIPDEMRKAAFQLLVISEAEARRLALERRRKPYGVAYQPSILRDWPVLAFDGGRRLRSPLRDLIIIRITSGVYYDVVGASSDVRREIGERFELYASRLTAAMLPGYEVRLPFEYGPKGRSRATPDIIVRNPDETVALVLECKAKRMSFEARYAEEPMAMAATGFEELAKGVTQIWRFYSDVRQGKVPKTHISSDAAGVVLTLDPWLMMAGPLRAEVMAKAEALASKQPQIELEDKKPVLFCSIESLEDALRHSTPDSFMARVRKASTPEYQGWMLSLVPMDEAEKQDRDYPFAENLSEVLPWWGASEERLASRKDLS